MSSPVHFQLKINQMLLATLAMLYYYLTRKMLYILPICTTILYDQRSDDFKHK
uniref:Uncharacterized protein n=1 Tax=Arundo donax TaxID=35708 RepID=A0A0A9DP42_ARUDO